MSVACRLDPGSAQLQADALEVTAALNPDTSSQPATLKQRADARFKAGDVHGAAEAYTALVELLQQQQHQQTEVNERHCSVPGACLEEVRLQNTQQTQQQQQQQPQLLAALSNRAACWLSLEQYHDCIRDCQAALKLGLDHGAEAAATAGAEGAVPSTPLLDVVVPVDGVVPGNTSLGTADASAALASLLQQLQLSPPEQLVTQPWAGAARVSSAARLLGRMAVAYGCLKATQQAVLLYGWAQRCWQAVGEEQRAAELAEDQQRLAAASSD